MFHNSWLATKIRSILLVLIIVVYYSFIEIYLMLYLI